MPSRPGCSHTLRAVHAGMVRVHPLDLAEQLLIGQRPPSRRPLAGLVIGRRGDYGQTSYNPVRSAHQEVLVSNEYPPDQVYNPWTIVNLVFEHLVEQGLHPTLGEADNPGEASAVLLRALGVTPGIDSGGLNTEEIHEELAALRARILEQG